MGVALRLFLPESWTSDRARLKRVGVPAEHWAERTKPEIALAEIDRMIAARVHFGCVLADAGYGLSAPFRQGLTARGLAWAVGIPRHLKVYPVGVQLIWPIAKRGRPRQHSIPDILSIPAEDMLADAKWQNITWRTGTKGKLKACFAAVRVRIADGPPQRIRDKGQQHLPGDEAWLIGEHRASGEKKYYLANLPAETNLRTLAAIIKARWICEQAHQQMKEELGLDHFEGRSWHGLHRHANGAGKTTTLLTMMGLATLQKGEILLDGKRIDQLPANRRSLLGLGLVPQTRNIFPSLSVEENLIAGLKAAPTSNIARAYELFPRLRERRHNPGNHLSGGEQQMLAIARTLLGKPSILLLDEPMEGLAPVVCDELMLALAKLSEDDRLSIVLVEQDVDLAIRTSNRTIIIDAGRVVFNDRSERLGSRPDLLAKHIVTTDPRRLAAKMIPNVPIHLAFHWSGPPSRPASSLGAGRVVRFGSGGGEVTGRTPI